MVVVVAEGEEVGVVLVVSEAVFFGVVQSMGASPCPRAMQQRQMASRQ